ncbi:MAG: methylated-DNA--[protein]-cysteine S-methyltransferase [Bacteroidales bacterium]|nr:methylated-DNA--[protein]-cysteine S-methyltransferase [Bacteroidales bacterium]
MSSKISIQYFKTPLGELILGSFEDKLCLCDWRYRKMRSEIDSRIQKSLQAHYVEEDTPILQKTRLQIEEYLKGDRKEFDIPFIMLGSDFQKEVWNELLTISYGEKETYLGLSKKINKESALRAIAAANGANAISIIIPCHRIIGSNQKLVGYAGGIQVKRKLLELESKGQADPWQLF